MPLGSTGVSLDYDVILEPNDGSGALGLMLAPITGQGTKAWHITEIPIPAGARVTDSGLGVQDLPPEYAASVFRSTNLDGLGFRLAINSQHGYMSGCVQTSVDGKIIKPPGSSEITLPTSEGKVLAMEEMTLSSVTYYYVTDGRYLHYSTNGTSFTQCMDAGSGNRISSLQKYGNAAGTVGMVVAIETDDALETPGLYYYTTDGTNFTQVSADATRHFNYFFVQDKTLFGLQNPNVYYTTTNPFSATPTWSGSTTVGDQSHKFQGGLVVAGVIVIAKEDRLYTVNGSGTVSTLVSQFAEIPSRRNFDQLVAGKDSNIYTTVEDDVWAYDPVSGDLIPMGLHDLPDRQLTMTNQPNNGLAVDINEVYTIHGQNLTASQGPSIVRIDTRQNTEVLGDPRPVFERWLTTTASGYLPQGPMKATRSFTSLTTGRHLFFNTTTAGKIGRMELPRAYDPTVDSGSVYDTLDNVYRSGWMHHNFAGEQKDYTQVIIDMGGREVPGSYVTAYYYLDGDLTTRYTLGRANTGVFTVLEFASGVTARLFLLELVLHSNSSSNTPEVVSWNVKASVKFPLKEIFTLKIRVGDKIRNRSGAAGTYSAKQIRERLRELRAARNIRIRYRDYRGYDITNVRILSGFEEVDEIDDNDRNDETIMTFRVLKIMDGSWLSTGLTNWEDEDTPWRTWTD